MNRKLSTLAIPILILTLLTLVACSGLAETQTLTTVSGEPLLLPMETPTLMGVEPCPGCAQATLAALQTQEKSNADAWAAATAAVLNANAQATLNSTRATLSVALTQEQNKADLIAAQAAATAAIVQANAQATLVAAQATQNIALTQDAIRQTQVQDSLRVTAEVATQNAIAVVTQKNNNFLAESTQTAVSNQIATQTQAAVATSQWYTDQERQRAEERQGPLTFLWMWCPPFFIVAIALVCFWFFWRWMKFREKQQQIDVRPVTTPRVGSEANPPLILEHEPRPVRTVANNQVQLAKPRDHVRRWLEEVERKLNTNQKDDDDHPAS